MKTTATLFIAATLTATATLIGGQQAAAPAVFSAEQAATGREAYTARCAGCHLADLGGRNEALPLAGSGFMNTWRARSVRDLVNYIHDTMPPGSANLTTEQATAIAAYILQVNGAQAGAQALAATSGMPIGSVATGQAPPAAQTATAAAPAPAANAGGAGRGRGQVAGGAPAGAPAGAPGGGRGAGRGGAPGGGRGGGGFGGDPDAVAPVVGRGAAAPARLGVTVAGEVKNYVPVTDAMLRNPDPGDWLMARRNYQAWSYSPLTEITKSNAGS
jgi:alcohol dehydrogenase (cytochrome c)